MCVRVNRRRFALDPGGGLGSRCMRSVAPIVLLLAMASPALAGDDDPIERGVDKGTFGVGLIVGEPTGITAKLYLRDDQAIQAGVGGAFIGGGIMVYADYVFHPYILQTRESFVL